MISFFLAAAFESQICEKCNVNRQLCVTTKTQVEPGIMELELTCMKCFEKSKHKSDCHTIESRFRPKAWLPNYLLLSFLLNSEYFKDYEHVLGTLGVSHLSKSQWIHVVTIKTFHSDLTNIKIFFIPLQCLFFSQRTLTTNITDIISLLFSSVNMRYRCSQYY